MSSNPSVKIAQPGYNVNTAPDWALIFNSEWPSLQIAFETTITNNSSKTSIQIAHNLGYTPLTYGYMTVNGTYWGRLNDTVDVDKNNIYIQSNQMYNGATITLRCYNVDVSKEATYTLPKSAAGKTSPDLTTFIKIVKQTPNTRSINSPNLNDFILNSQAQSPAVLDVATEKGQYYLNSSARHYWPFGNIPTGGWELIVYPLQTSYIPFYTAAFGPDTYEFASGNSVYYDSTTNSLVLNISATTSGSLIVLRDPLFYPNVVRAIYE